MAKVTVTFEDVGPADDQRVDINIESDPHIPIKGGVPDVDSPEFTGAMSFAIGSVMEAAEHAKSAITVVRDGETGAETPLNDDTFKATG